MSFWFFREGKGSITVFLSGSEQLILCIVIRYALLPEENKICPAEVLVLMRGVSRNGTGRLFILIHITIGAGKLV